jgi:DNA-binding transcriptional LysR family regulator
MSHLELVLAIGEYGNLQRAAVRLNMSQPAASKLVAEIERTLGTSLFDRSPRGLVPNRFGEPLVRHARTALSALSEAAREIAALQTGHAGSTRVGAVTAPALELVASAAADLQSSHPKIEVLIEVGTSRHLVQQLQQGRLDYALARLPPEENPKHFDYEPMGVERLCFICRSSHDLAGKRMVAARDLAGQAWVLQLRGTLLRRKIDSLFLEHGLRPPERVIESESFEVSLAIVLQSDALAVVPNAVADLYNSSGQITTLRFAEPFALAEYGLIRMRGQPLSPASEFFIAQIRRRAEQLTPDLS